MEPRSFKWEDDDDGRSMLIRQEDGRQKTAEKSFAVVSDDLRGFQNIEGPNNNVSIKIRF